MQQPSLAMPNWSTHLSAVMTNTVRYPTTDEHLALVRFRWWSACGRWLNIDNFLGDDAIRQRMATRGEG